MQCWTAIFVVTFFDSKLDGSSLQPSKMVKSHIFNVSPIYKLILTEVDEGKRYEGDMNIDVRIFAWHSTDLETIYDR